MYENLNNVLNRIGYI